MLTVTCTYVFESVVGQPMLYVAPRDAGSCRGCQQLACQCNALHVRLVRGNPCAMCDLRRRL
jgi:hypothetical protein